MKGVFSAVINSLPGSVDTFCSYLLSGSGKSCELSASTVTKNKGHFVDLATLHSSISAELYLLWVLLTEQINLYFFLVTAE